MSNPKILLPLIAIALLVCVCGAGQLAFDARKAQDLQTSNLLELGQTQARAIEKQANAIDTMAHTLDRAFTEQQKTIDRQDFTIKAQTWYVIIIGAIAIILLFAYIGSRKGR